MGDSSILNGNSPEVKVEQGHGIHIIRRMVIIINSVVCHLNVYVGKERILCFWVAMLVAPSFDAVTRVVMTTQP